MLNIIWMSLIVLSVVFGAINGRIPEVTAAVTDYAKFAFELALTLTGVMAFWLGTMRIAQDAGLIQVLSRWLRPIMRRLFPDVPVEHPAMGCMITNMAANMLGLNNAATPMGVKAMHELESLNETPGTATDAMCMFLALNTSSVQLIPTTAIAFLAASGATHPTFVIVPALFATSCSTLAAIVAAKWFSRRRIFREALA